jgi:hypothetical protein
MIVAKPSQRTSFTPPHLHSLPQPRPALPTTQRPHTTFFRPLFSYSYELLFPQLLYFDNDLNCPGVLPLCGLRAPTPSTLCRAFLATVLLSGVCALSFSLAAFFRTRSLCFQWLAHSLRKSTGVFFPTAITARAVAYMKCRDICVAANLSVRNCYVSIAGRRVTWTRRSHQSIIVTRSRAASSRFQVHG